jgi:ABC-type transport system involved in multi-copper enzyme maturation permease subunit
MATTAGKTIGLILIVLFILWLGVRLTPLILAPFGFFTGAFHNLRMDGFPGVFQFTSISFFSLVLLFIWLAVIVWIYRDAERRGMNGVLWALLVLIGNIIGLLIYLIVRTDDLPQREKNVETRPCPSCQKYAASTFSFCPHCGSRMEHCCGGCGQSTDQSWKICPHCGEKLKA